MFKILSGQSMQALDEQAIACGIPGLILMENAARAAVDAFVAQHGLPQSLWMLCGKGNNGGDGLAMARHFHNRGCQVELLLLSEPTALSPDAAENWKMLQSLDLPILCTAKPEQARQWLARSPQPDWIVDAILGTGLTSAARGIALEAIQGIPPGVPVLSVDLPSGLSGDSSILPGVAVQAQHTVTFGLPKICHYFYPAASYCGSLTTVEISLPRQILEAAPPACWGGRPPRDWMPARLPDGHKGTFGHVLALAGSPGMSGAAVLAARSALRAGAGLVTVATPEALLSILENQSKESMTLPLPTGEDGGLDASCLPVLLNFLQAKKPVLLLGPGLGTAPSTREIVQRLLSQVSRPCVLDADALNCIASLEDPEEFLQRLAHPILTPHPGEMARLLGRPVKDRLQDAQDFAQRTGSTVVLKGAGTVVTDGVTAFVVQTGNPGMASGGTGDVLAGLVASLMAQGLSPFKAGALGAYLHGLAGDLAAEELGEEALLASDLIHFFPRAWKTWKQRAEAEQAAPGPSWSWRA